MGTGNGDPTRRDAAVVAAIRRGWPVTADPGAIAPRIPGPLSGVGTALECPGWDSNPHGLQGPRPQLPVRLPFRHLCMESCYRSCEKRRSAWADHRWPADAWRRLETINKASRDSPLLGCAITTSGAQRGSRTPTTDEGRQVLSLVRLPVPPPTQEWSLMDGHWGMAACQPWTTGWQAGFISYPVGAAAGVLAAMMNRRMARFCSR